MWHLTQQIGHVMKDCCFAWSCFNMACLALYVGACLLRSERA